MIKFNSQSLTINDWHIILLPTDISKELPSRGMVMAEVQINQVKEILPLEPDGYFSHWFKLPDRLNGHDLFDIRIRVLTDWPAPELPQAIEDKLIQADLLETWLSLTAKAKWEWIRWIRFTKNPDTSHKRQLTMIDMLANGKKRPCCFDQTRCTITQISKSGKLNKKTL